MTWQRRAHSGCCRTRHSNRCPEAGSQSEPPWSPGRWSPDKGMTPASSSYLTAHIPCMVTYLDRRIRDVLRTELYHTEKEIHGLLTTIGVRHLCVVYHCWSTLASGARCHLVHCWGKCHRQVICAVNRVKIYWEQLGPNRLFSVDLCWHFLKKSDLVFDRCTLAIFAVLNSELNLPNLRENWLSLLFFYFPAPPPPNHARYSVDVGIVEKCCPTTIPNSRKLAGD